ncbi:MAG: hypothetical protein LBU26_00450 [Synergistaceae bacterium]|nr:hypothetical protein [Synergistaceae bacterium]
MMENFIDNSGTVMVILAKRGLFNLFDTVAHQVVAFGYHVDKNDNIRLLIYDCNWPGVTRYIDYDDRIGEFKSYNGGEGGEGTDYDLIGFGGEASMMGEEYTNAFSEIVRREN